MSAHPGHSAILAINAGSVQVFPPKQDLRQARRLILSALGGRKGRSILSVAQVAEQRITLENAVVGWSLHAMPLHLSANDGVLEWAAGARFSRGVPEQPPKKESLPSVAQVLAAFTAAQCHGTAWFALCDSAGSPALAPCSDPSACVLASGLDLGEVSLHLMGQNQVASEVRSDALVEMVSFRKPNGSAVLEAVCGLAAVAGPHLVFDDSADQVFVVRPAERAEDLVQEWPWLSA